MIEMEPHFVRINDMLKRDPEHTTENICRCMLEAGFQVNDTFVAVCDEKNFTYAGIYPNRSVAESEAKGKYYVEQEKRLVKDSFYEDDYEWERVKIDSSLIEN